MPDKASQGNQIEPDNDARFPTGFHFHCTIQKQYRVARKINTFIETNNIAYLKRNSGPKLSTFYLKEKNIFYKMVQKS